jgi:alcohol dehydrogenase class IV
MLPVFKFMMPPAIYFGNDSSRKIADIVSSFGVSKILIVTGKVIRSSGMLESVEKALKSVTKSCIVYDGIEQEPITDYIETGLEVYRKNKCELILGLGGGSPLDAAKAISAMTANEGKISDYKGTDKLQKRGAPIIAIPTTAGTGSEVTRYLAITDPATSVKMLITSPHIIPDVAIVDPVLTVSCPQGLTAATGIDALTHAIEAYVSVKANPLSDMFALQAVNLLAGNLRAAWANGNNLKSREKVMIGAMYAGIAFCNSSVALVHGMSRPIGANFHIAHGISNAAILGTVMDFSYIGNAARYADLAEAMGNEVHGLSEMEGARTAVDSVKELIANLEIPTLKGLGLDKKKIEALAQKMAEDAIASGSPGNNPRIATAEEIAGLYLEAYKE